MADEAYPCPCDIGHQTEYGGMEQEVQVEHIKAYVTRSPVDAGKAVIVIQDIFDQQSPNTRDVADMTAGNGYTTIVPDFFGGQEPWDPSGDWPTFLEWLKTRTARKIHKEISAILKYLKQQLSRPENWRRGLLLGRNCCPSPEDGILRIQGRVSVYGIAKDSEDVQV
ncbi:Carboxymethylenebutenolidase like protein [Tupaia chinensis]|uniref:Carboxymethylenebutenolidase homolog n=1 Tax=Tupaia chinensis TaxID=246437 RepID=L9KY23_TUPCH|nr:Carboxymethylenebutenolidase like protein [Tupaia chinensis]